MKEQGMSFTDEQKELLHEIEELEKETGRDSLHTLRRMLIADMISKKYSMLKNDNMLFQSQLFSAMEDYLKECTKKNYELKGL